MTPLEGFSEFSFTFEDSTRPVYYQGNGPAVVIMHELPGMIPECIDLARRIAKEGFTVFLPLLIGKPNQPFSILRTLAYTVQICLSREFYCFVKRQSSPITNWLRALCREVYARCDNRGVGVIGMCLTGGFVLSLMVDEVVMAPVASQPSLPFAVTPAHKSALGISSEELEKAKERAAEGVNILALRFTEDRTCPAERFVTLRREFGDAIETIEIDSFKDNPDGIPHNAHAVLTVHFVDREGHPTRKAFDRVLTFLKEKM
ncbi:MAG: dienelactone hydrolase family protein [Xenococcaceae cyanobacterium]